MFALTHAYQYYLYAHPCDMRKSFDGLSGIVVNELGQDPLQSQVFIFLNRSRTLIKLLQWQSGGYVLYYKRLEKGHFPRPIKKGSSHQISWVELCGMLSGMQVQVRQKSKHYAHQKKEIKSL